MARRSGRRGGKGRSAAQKAHSIANLKAYREARAKAKAAPDKKAAAAAKSKATRAELKAHDKKMATGVARGKAAATKAAKAKAATAVAKKSESAAKSKATRAALKQHDAKMATGVARGKAAETKKAGKRTGEDGGTAAQTKAGMDLAKAKSPDAASDLKTYRKAVRALNDTDPAVRKAAGETIRKMQGSAKSYAARDRELAAAAGAGKKAPVKRPAHVGPALPKPTGGETPAERAWRRADHKGLVTLPKRGPETPAQTAERRAYNMEVKKRGGK